MMSLKGWQKLFVMCVLTILKSVVVVRPFNNYGPGLDIQDGRLPADLAKFILSKNDIKIYSDGKPTDLLLYI